MDRTVDFKRLICMLSLILVVFIPGCTSNSNKNIKVVEKGYKENQGSDGLESIGVIQKTDEYELFLDIELEEIPSDFSLQDAKDAGMLVLEEMAITSGRNRWKVFLDNVRLGVADTIYIANYYEIGDKSQYAPELYEEIKDDYPVLYISKLAFDGEKYTKQHYEESKLYTYEYTYLLERIGWLGGTARIAQHFFALADKDDLSYHEIEWSMFSSSSTAWRDYKWVFTESVSLEDYNSRKPGIYKTENGLASLTLEENYRFSFNRNIATSYDPTGRYYIEEDVLILHVSEEEEYSFGIVGDGTLEFLSGDYAESLVPIGTKFYREPQD